MSRPFKRPRLHFLAPVSPDPDGELAIARARNDGLLKTRWEHIFARYEKDFEGIGDEISMFDDEIVVDNGHIKSMQNARDTGTTRIAEQSITSPSRYDGRRLLRAMTVAPSEDSEDSASDNDADEVLQSIEIIADNIMMDEESSEDDLFDTQPSTNGSTHAERPAFRKRSEEVEIKSESDVDTLFNTRPVIRSPSIDDLFYTRSSLSPPADPVSSDPRSGPVHTLADTPETSYSSLPPRDTIDRAFIREEIRKALEEENQAQESQIEPAWRIPVRLVPSRTSQSLPAAAPLPDPNPELQTIQTLDTPALDEEQDEDDENSLWKAPARTRRSKREVAAARNLKRLRAESEDPLQDGFTSEIEQPSSTSSIGVRRSKLHAEARSSHDSSSRRSSSLSLHRWQKPTSAEPAPEDDTSENEDVSQRQSKTALSSKNNSYRSTRGSVAPSSASDTIIVKVPEARRTSLQKEPDG